MEMGFGREPSLFLACRSPAIMVDRRRLPIFYYVLAYKENLKKVPGLVGKIKNLLDDRTPKVPTNQLYSL